MNSAIVALGAAAVVLAGIIAFEVQGIEGDPVTSGASAAAVARWRPAPAVPTPPAPDRSRDWAATALARPLFVPDRKPVAEPRGAVVAGATARDLPRLTGVLVSPGGTAAIFAGAEGAKPQVVRVGDALGSYEVKAILAGEVTLAGPEGDRVLRPSFDARRAPPPPTAVPLAVSPGLPGVAR